MSDSTKKDFGDFLVTQGGNSSSRCLTHLQSHVLAKKKKSPPKNQHTVIDRDTRSYRCKCMETDTHELRCTDRHIQTQTLIPRSTAYVPRNGLTWRMKSYCSISPKYFVFTAPTHQFCAGLCSRMGSFWCSAWNASGAEGISVFITHRGSPKLYNHPT